MAQNRKSGGGYDALVAAIKSGNIGSFYIFHGEERYLLEHSLAEIRRRLCPDGLGGFNYSRFEGGGFSLDDLDSAINTLPVFAERTLVEVRDYDIFGSAKKASGAGFDDKTRLTALIEDLPEYVCVILIFDTLPYKPDGRVGFDKGILKAAQAVEFTAQQQDKLVAWIRRHFNAAGKDISKQDAEYLALISGGYMNSISGEIEKLAAYARSGTVTAADIDAVVTPVLDAAAYKLTDALLGGRYPDAVRILDELLRMREAPQKILFNISLKMRQLLAARVLIENNADRAALMDMCGIRFDFQASALMSSARKTTLIRCREAALRCAEAAYSLNSSSEPEALLTELIAKLALKAG